MRKINSKKYLEQAYKCFPHLKEEQPFVIKRAKRSSIYDYDNNCFTDYYLSKGSLIFGHAFPNSVLAAKKTAEKGICFSIMTAEEIELSGFFMKHIKSAESVLFFQSDTEALIESVLLSKVYSKKHNIIKFNGSHDVLTRYFSNEGEVISIPCEDPDIFMKTLEQYKDSTACVIIEPVAIEGTLKMASHGFLKDLESISRQFNILLVFDEIDTCFRTNIGGYQAEAGIHPDITCFGKIFAAGFSTGAICGKREVLKALKPTFNVSPVALKASIATLKYLNRSFYDKLNNKCSRIKDELNSFFSGLNIDVKISSYGSLMHINIKNELLCKLSKSLFKKGIYFPINNGLFCVSLFHTKQELELFISSVIEFFQLNKIQT